MRFDPDAVEQARRNALRKAWGLGGDGADRAQPGAAHRLEGAERADRGRRAAAARRARRCRRSCWPATSRAAAAIDASWRRLIAARGLGGRVRIVGHCDDVPAAFAIADVAVIASTEPEAFGRAAVEAEAMGVPVVATALGAAPETVLAPPEVDAAAAHRLARPAQRAAGARRGDRRGARAGAGRSGRRLPDARAPTPGDSRSRRCARRRLPSTTGSVARRPPGRPRNRQRTAVS